MSIASIVNVGWKSQIVDIVDLLLNRHCSEKKFIGQNHHWIAHGALALLHQ